MIEKIILDYLADALTVPVYAEDPEESQQYYVTIMKTGSSVQNHIGHAMLVLRSYAPTLLEAAELNETVKTAMNNAVCLDAISASRLNSDYNYTDAARKRYRYQAIYDVYGMWEENTNV